MVMAVVGIGVLYIGAILLPRVLVACAAALVAAILAVKARGLTRLILVHSPRDLDYDRKPSRAQRRVMRASLQVALDQTELRSLFPTLVGRADRCVRPTR
ncbi:hypothetical protein [Sphingomonas sp. 3P27F8]|uniref:hypothetical protein n=1 Tax=Sphingomonas sp. 3P27F8 TaxID=2502213 RepID=UPI0010F72847|nr:hypothetical protein [Sphingomonas sp. 3P27F8]